MVDHIPVEDLYHCKFRKKMVSPSIRRSGVRFPDLKRHEALLSLQVIPTKEEAKEIAGFVRFSDAKMTRQVLAVQSMICAREANIMSGHKPFSYRVDDIPMVPFAELIHRSKQVVRDRNHGADGMCAALTAALAVKYEASVNNNYLRDPFNCCANPKRCVGHVFHECIEDSIFFECKLCCHAWGTTIDSDFDYAENIISSRDSVGYVADVSFESQGGPEPLQINRELYETEMMAMPAFAKISKCMKCITGDDYIELRILSQEDAQQIVSLLCIFTEEPGPRLKHVWFELESYARAMSES